MPVDATKSVQHTLSPTEPAKKFAQHSPTTGTSAKKFAQHGASSGISAKKLAQQAQNHQFWGVFSALGELFRARTHIKPHGANFFAHRTHQRGDVETNDTSAATDAGHRETPIITAHPSTATIETDNTSATKKRTKNTHFTPAKAMTVSTEAQPARAKAMTVSTDPPHRPAKAMVVSVKLCLREQRPHGFHPHTGTSEQRRHRFHATDLRHPRVATCPLPRKLARNSIG